MFGRSSGPLFVAGWVIGGSWELVTTYSRAYKPTCDWGGLAIAKPQSGGIEGGILALAAGRVGFAYNPRPQKSLGYAPLGPHTASIGLIDPNQA